MTRRSICGWEMGSIEAEPYNTDGTISGLAAVPAGTGISLEASIVRTGSGSLKAGLTSGVAGTWTITDVGAIGFYYRVYIRVTAKPATTARRILGSSGSINISLNSAGTLEYRNGGTLIGTSSTALTDTTKWYCVEWTRVNGTSITVLKIDNVSQITGSPSSWTFTQTFGTSDTVADTYTAYFDDFVSDSTTWVGAGAVVLLKPISDNARATLWTGGAGGTTNLYDAVNNTPPIGTATETNLTQIEHAGGAAGTADAYDANMTTYSTAGIVAGDTVNAVMPFINSGEDISTGDKLLKFQILSNPATTATGNFNAASVSSALGTWPTGWHLCTGPIGDSPSVTVGNSPVFRVIRPETAARVASVCFMGIYVDYTPAPTVTLSSPADAASISDSTPDLVATGTLAGYEVEYQVQVDTVNTFDSVPLGFDLKYIDAWIAKVGSPSDNLTVKVLHTSINGTLMGTSNTVAGSSVSTTAANVRFTFATPITLSGATVYYLQMERSGARDETTHYYKWYSNTANIYSGGVAYSKVNASWNEATFDDRRFILYDTDAIAKISQLVGTTAINLYGGSGAGFDEAQGQSFTVNLTTPIIDKASDTPSIPGFAGTGDPHPWPSGNAVTYTVQGADALADGTYYWRVRGKVFGGTYGLWATTRSFVLSTGGAPVQPFRHRLFGVPATTSRDRPKSWN